MTRCRYVVNMANSELQVPPDVSVPAGSRSRSVTVTRGSQEGVYVKF